METYHLDILSSLPSVVFSGLLCFFTGMFMFAKNMLLNSRHIQAGTKPRRGIYLTCDSNFMTGKCSIRSWREKHPLRIRITMSGWLNERKDLPLHVCFSCPTNATRLLICCFQELWHDSSWLEFSVAPPIGVQVVEGDCWWVGLPIPSHFFLHSFSQWLPRMDDIVEVQERCHDTCPQRSNSTLCSTWCSDPHLQVLPPPHSPLHHQFRGVIDFWEIDWRKFSQGCGRIGTSILQSWRKQRRNCCIQLTPHWR